MIEMVEIPSGSFLMGSPESEKDRYVDEAQHRVIISRPFLMQTTPVTQAQWKAVMGNNLSILSHRWEEVIGINPSKFKGEDMPVENVSWNDVQFFLKILNEKEGGVRYRLPSEAEWEYACRTGSTTAYYYGDDEERLGEYAWYDGNSEHTTHSVGLKKPNDWGLYDMHGNVYEWVQDRYEEYYLKRLTINPSGPPDGAWRVLRGGSWDNVPEDLRTSSRFWGAPGGRDYRVGFRCAASIE